MNAQSKNVTLWHAKLAAWTHDPAENALVLLRDPAGHEWGTAADLRERIFGRREVPPELKHVVEQADRWASAADRPQWPRDETDGRFAPWTKVRFTEQPVLIHPLSGEEYALQKLSDISVEDIKDVSSRHFVALIDEHNDAKRNALAFWRFGPALREVSDIGGLWGQLPADTRVPDHTIWQHLDLTSAFAGAFFCDSDNPALLTISFGPVQDFIAQARTTSDLWAGSHLLSRIAWEGLKVVCEDFGPDAVLFPQLRGIPQVDLWLRDEVQLPAKLFEDEDWRRGRTDSNPVFSAALPNKFVAIVPASAAVDLARRIESRVREWTLVKAREALSLLLDRAKKRDVDENAASQLDAQFNGFPEVHWAAAPWRPFVAPGGAAPDVTALRDALSGFRPASAPDGFLDSKAWGLLCRELKVKGQRFYSPNAGVLYPAIYELLERTQAAAKSVRPFRQLRQDGYRCSLCGEREWITHDRALLSLPPGRRAASLWGNLKESGWARKGEHLCALCSLKRMWPSLYCREATAALGGAAKRFVVSTHTMALAASLERWLKQSDRRSLPERWFRQLRSYAQEQTVALPRKLLRYLNESETETEIMLRGLPLLLEDLKERSQSDDLPDRQAEKVETERGALEKALEEVLGSRPETYYAFIMMDGDRMGAWLSGQGEGESYRLPFESTWHPQVRCAVDARHPTGDINDYRKASRPASPARHMAISSALNGFSLHVARYVVEEVGKGKLIYAGGDDVLAMVSVDDLLSVMFLLRLAYGGLFPVASENQERARELTGLRSADFELGGGFVRRDGVLYRMMGHRATASAGAVVAHYQAPLGQVLRTLRAAEQRAKNAGGRDAFAITLLKRSGGATHLTCPWLNRKRHETGDWRTAMTHNPEETPIGQLIRLRDQFAGQMFSRRAAYLTQGWLTDVPRAALPEMLGYQFARQTEGGSQSKEVAASQGRALGKLAVNVSDEEPEVAVDGRIRSFIEDFLAVAEFLAREGRTEVEVGAS